MIEVKYIRRLVRGDIIMPVPVMLLFGVLPILLATAGVGVLPLNIVYAVFAGGAWITILGFAQRAFESKEALREFKAVGKQPYHMLRVLVRVPLMIDYYMHLTLAAVLNFFMTFNRWIAEAFWPRGRQAIASAVLGVKRAFTEKASFQGAYHYIKDRGILVAVLFLMLGGVVLWPALDSYVMPYMKEQLHKVRNQKITLHTADKIRLTAKELEKVLRGEDKEKAPGKKEVISQEETCCKKEGCKEDRQEEGGSSSSPARDSSSLRVTRSIPCPRADRASMRT